MQHYLQNSLLNTVSTFSVSDRAVALFLSSRTDVSK